MACPTCDHTMQSVAEAVFWCPRCGTLRMTNVKSAYQADEVPKAVTLAREIVDGEQRRSDMPGFSLISSSEIDDLREAVRILNR